MQVCDVNFVHNILARIIQSGPDVKRENFNSRSFDFLRSWLSVTRWLNCFFKFGHFNNRNLPNGIIFLPKQALNLANYQINLQKIAKDFQNFTKVAKFRQIWSHCWSVEQKSRTCSLFRILLLVHNSKMTSKTPNLKIVKNLNITIWQNFVQFNANTMKQYVFVLVELIPHLLPFKPIP